MKYIFKMKYTDDTKYEREIEAKDPIDAWTQYLEWVSGFIKYGNDFLESVKVTVKVR